ncbi:hypothetical protein DV096_00050 [Bradymonadaceae bacterium TMQ3]|nr:hypothetical protein DV096_00050 [Bradymonadaceae bacterium TMQ3]
MRHALDAGQAIDYERRPRMVFARGALTAGLCDAPALRRSARSTALMMGYERCGVIASQREV